MTKEDEDTLYLLNQARRGVVTIGDFTGHYSQFKKPELTFERTYHLPKFTGEVECLLACGKDWKHHRSSNLLFTGNHGTGKTEFTQIISEKCGFSKVFHVNGREDMCSGDFLGEPTVQADLKTLQNRIVFRKGALYQAFIEGTLLDEEGNQVLDENGNPTIVGKPGLFFLDEFAAVLPGVFLSVFNRAMEIPRNPGESRSLEISLDGGKVVKSHPGFAMIFSGNTVGRGTESESSMGYTAQNNVMDDSTLNRFTAIFPFDFNLEAEKEIMEQTFLNDRMTDQFSKFVSEARGLFENGKISTLISTRTIVNILDVYQRLQKLYVPTETLKVALERCLLTGLREFEKQAWKELVRARISE